MDFNKKYKLIIIIVLILIAFVAVFLLEMEDQGLSSERSVQGTQVETEIDRSNVILDPSEKVQELYDDVEEISPEEDNDNQGDNSQEGNVETFVIVTE